jgi:hypothetical protein
MSRLRTAFIPLFVLLVFHAPAYGQVNGNVAVMVDALPDVSESPGSQSEFELRTRVFGEWRHTVGEHLSLNVSGYVDGLLADRGPTGNGAARDAIVRPGDVYVEYTTGRFDVRAGMSRIVWGRLDEFQPTDVVNPLDLTRFLLDGRTEARLPVGLVRGRLFLAGNTTLEAILVPAFRAGRFDQVEESSAPFNLLPAGDVDVVRLEPQVRPRNVQGGARLTTTTGRVDWALTAYRGFRTFPTVTIAPTFAPPPLAIETFPRFTMIGGDVETVHGAWGIRGEAAAFIEDELQSTRLARGVPGHGVDAGVGVDRKAGSYRIAGDVLWSTRHLDAGDDGTLPDPARSIAADEVNRTDLNLVVAADRSFARGTRTLRIFLVGDPVDKTTFARAIAAVSLRDNVWLEGSGGLFVGTAEDTLGRLSQRDFLYARLKVFF